MSCFIVISWCPATTASGMRLRRSRYVRRFCQRVVARDQGIGDDLFCRAVACFHQLVKHVSCLIGDANLPTTQGGSASDY